MGHLAREPQGIYQSAYVMGCQFVHAACFCQAKDAHTVCCSWRRRRTPFFVSMEIVAIAIHGALHELPEHVIYLCEIYFSVMITYNANATNISASCGLVRK